MRIFNVGKIHELIEECGADKEFMDSKWVALADVNKLVIKIRNDRSTHKCQRILDSLSNEKTEE